MVWLLASNTIWMWSVWASSSIFYMEYLSMCYFCTLAQCKFEFGLYQKRNVLWRHRLAKCIPIGCYALFMLMQPYIFNMNRPYIVKHSYNSTKLATATNQSIQLNYRDKNPCSDDREEWKTNELTKISANFIFITRIRRQHYRTTLTTLHT